MAISHELSSEIATALFAAKKRSPRELNDLKEMIFKIHYTLQQLSDDARADRRASRAESMKAAQPSGPSQ